MCLTHFSIALALLALGDWIAVAAEPPGLGASFLPNPVCSGVGNRGKASPGTRSGRRGAVTGMETRVGAPRGRSSRPSLAVRGAAPAALAQWPRSAIPHGFPGRPRGRAPAGRALARRLARPPANPT